MSGRRTVVVTGASSGIGAATAVAFGARGARVLLGARRLERLREVAERVAAAGGEAVAHALDVSRADSIDAFWDAAEKELGAVDVLVSNAGMSKLNLVCNAAPEDLAYEVAVNLTGPMFLARRAIPAMLERRAGDLVFVSSENAVRPRPYQAGYSAGKAGIETFARVLEMELEGTGVRPVVVRPGATASEFGSGMHEATLHEALAAWKYWGVQRALHWMPTEAVANAIVRAVEAPVEESHVTLLHVMPGGRKREEGS